MAQHKTNELASIRQTAESALEKSVTANGTWAAGNTESYVTAIINGKPVPLAIRDGGDRSVSPLSTEGAVHWKLNYTEFISFDATLAKYYAIGQTVFYYGRLYEMKRTYSVPPDTTHNATDDNWRDIFADAATGNEPADPSNGGTETSHAFTKIDASSYTDV